MEYVLTDIKNFLKKLENGQLEIEAGQWELHKALFNVNKAVTELKELKEDVEDMKLNSMQQMGLIKELQVQLQKLRENDLPETVSDCSLVYEKSFKTANEGQGFKKKRKCRIRSEEIIEITSQVSNDKSESDEVGISPGDERCPAETNRTEFTTKCNEHISDDESSPKDYQRVSCVVPKSKQSHRYPVCSDILQRYLKDSVKYIERKLSKSTEQTHPNSIQSEEDESNCPEYRSFWDEYSSRAPPKSAVCENRNIKGSNENLAPTEKPVETVPSKRFPCPKCPKKFKYKIDSIKHQRKHRVSQTVYLCKACGKGFGSKDRLKEHEAVHKITKLFKGFRCSYCNKICSSPEKLTSHLRKCRIIMKAHRKKK